MKLVKIKPTGIRITVVDDHDKDSLIAACIMMQRKYPNESFGVTDEYGYYIWPENLAASHLLPPDYDPSKGVVPKRYGSTDNG